jgi:type IV pilus assembly protein PilN
MRYPINLSSEPFRRDRSMIVASSALAVVLVLTLGLLGALIANERSQKRNVLEATEQAEAQLQKIAVEQAQLESTLRQPENADVLERSVFLNTLIARKGISWTRLFADLEEVLPYNVRLVSIRPQTDPANNIQLDMTVGAQSAEPVIEFLKRMEASSVFSSPTVANGLPPSQSEPLYRYRVSVNYAQKL